MFWFAPTMRKLLLCLSGPDGKLHAETVRTFSAPTDVVMIAPDLAITKFGTAQLLNGTFPLTTRFYPAIPQTAF